MAPLTEIQSKVLTFVSDKIRDTRIPPSLKEISAAFGWSTHAAASGHLTALERKGRIKRHEGVARGITIVEDQSV